MQDKLDLSSEQMMLIKLIHNGKVPLNINNLTNIILKHYANNHFHPRVLQVLDGNEHFTIGAFAKTGDILYLVRIMF